MSVNTYFLTTPALECIQHTDEYLRKDTYHRQSSRSVHDRYLTLKYKLLFAFGQRRHRYYINCVIYSYTTYTKKETVTVRRFNAYVVTMSVELC